MIKVWDRLLPCWPLASADHRTSCGYGRTYSGSFTSEVTEGSKICEGTGEKKKKGYTAVDTVYYD